MSQVCPSSSHQLVAAAIAFRRARRKFPRNYGLSNNLEQTSRTVKVEGSTIDKELYDQNDPKDTTSVEHHEEKRSSTENPQENSIICSCCRKRNETVSTNDSNDVSKSKDACSAGDAVDNSPNGGSNAPATLSAKRTDVRYDAITSSSLKESKSFNRCSTPCTHCRRQNSRDVPTRSDFVNLLYDGQCDERTNVKYCSSLDESKQDCTCDSHPVKQRNLDQSRSRQDHRFRENHRLQNCQNSRHRCCSHHECNSCSTKEKPCLLSDTCLRSSNYHRNACTREESSEGAQWGRNYRSKNLEDVSNVQEQNDEECDDCVGVINHKDSLCILVEKYKTGRRTRQKKFTGQSEELDECNKSLTSEMDCQSNANEDSSVERRAKAFDNERNRESRVISTGKTCRHGCVQIFKETDSDQLRSLKSRLRKTGTCCSAKGTPWRHTF